MKYNHYYKDDLKKMLILYGISFIIIIVILFYAFLQIYSKHIVTVNNKKYNEFTNTILFNGIKAYEDKIYDFEKDQTISKYFLTGKNQSEVYDEMYKFINSTKLKSVFYIVDTKGDTLLTSNYVDSPYNSYEIFISGLFKQLKNNPKNIVYMNNKIQIDLTKRTIYSIGKAIMINGEIKGYLVFDILESELKKEILNTDVETLVITDKYNNAILATNNVFLDDIGKFSLKSKFNNVKSTIEFNDKIYYYNVSNLFNGTIIIYTLSELNSINDLLATTILFAFITMLGLFIITIIMADYIAKKKTKSIELLINSINQVQDGNLNAFLDIKSGDEFELIGKHFNKMLNRLELLINKNLELTNRNQIAEIKQLESQFNPHFIFNTLETLKYMIAIDKEKATEMIIKFANILRYSIDYENKTIKLEQDISYLNNYLTIQKFRYNDRLTYEMNIEEDSKKLIVPKLILQPIIENCINHSYKRKESLHIVLDISIINNELIMVVKDNGDGITKSRLNEIMLKLDDNSIENNNIGLSNIHRRLKLLFGEKYGIFIESEEKIGTIVTIKIPKINESLT